jgi:hypothetical protein
MAIVGCNGSAQDAAVLEGTPLLDDFQKVCVATEHLPRHLGSTDRRRTGIPMQVHPVPRDSLKLRNLSLPGQGRMDNLLRAHN